MSSEDYWQPDGKPMIAIRVVSRAMGLGFALAIPLDLSNADRRRYTDQCSSWRIWLGESDKKVQKFSMRVFIQDGI
jgi:hypothetical protein